jgi:hypothetical protein
MLLRGELSPNMAFLWLAHAYALVGCAPGGREAADEER